MALLDKPLADVTEEDLRALISTKVAEQRTLDYKRDLPKNDDKGNVELRADVSSFANAAGGHLIFGMDEKKGIAVDLCGVETSNADAEIRRMEQIIHAGVRPPILGLASHAIHLGSGRTVIVMRIPRSWAAPPRRCANGSRRAAPEHPDARPRPGISSALVGIPMGIPIHRRASKARA